MTRGAVGRRASTLVELLVAVGIIAVLSGLLLPAVQKVRTAAARLNCQNNLKQVGLAAQHYHAAHQSLPPGVTASELGEPLKLVTWLARLLPFADQDPLWTATVAAYQAQPGNPFGGLHSGFSTPVKLFACPADDRLVRPHVTGAGFYAAHTSYLGASGTDYLSGDGVYYYGSAARLTDITDGTSNTIAAGERPPGAGYTYGWWYVSGWSGKQGGTAVIGVRELKFANDVHTMGCPRGPYQFRPGEPDERCDVFHFWSLHPGGANFAFCDGSVRFLPYAADPLLPALATRAGGEVAALPD